jgi:hypothetical protein
MKKLVYMFLLVGSLLIGANVVNAAGKNKTRMKYVSCSDQTTQIKELIGTPDLSLSESSSVKVKFSISEDNIITVTDVKTDNEQLRNFVTSRLNGKRINGNHIEMKDQSLNLMFLAKKEEIYTIY